MKLANCLIPSAACLLGAAPLAQAGDVAFSGEPVSRAARAGTEPAGAWIAGASSVRLEGRQRSDLVRQPEGGAVSAAPIAESRASEVHAGYRGAVGSFDYTAQVRYDSLPDFHAGTAERGAMSAALGWHDLYARYDYTFTHDYLGGYDGYGSRYLDIGARHAFGHATWLHLNAGDSRTAGGNAMWNWRDLRAGFTRRLDDGWTMALNYRRVYGNATVAERYSGAPRFEGLIPGIGRGHRGLVLSFNRGF